MGLELVESYVRSSIAQQIIERMQKQNCTSQANGVLAIHTLKAGIRHIGMYVAKVAKK
jgi:hypothetical protein